ncbi:MAG: rhodanese-like domain-containing protein [Acidimicrobiales bacterium]|jgi:rhodanese-related sulfurtransferase
MVIGLELERDALASEGLVGVVDAGHRRKIADFVRPYLPTRGRMSPRQLGALTAAAAANRLLWQGLVVEDAECRWYLRVHRSQTCDLWLLGWMPGQDTDWHDHGGSSGSLCVAEGVLTENFRTSGGHRVRSRQLRATERAIFGPAHVHNVTQCGEAPAVSVHAYSPPLAAMTYYELGPTGLVASETVEVFSPEGPRRELARHRAPQSVDDLVADARLEIEPLSPAEAERALACGATLVDIRPVEQRREEGEIPGAMVIGRNVLEWRLDPRSEARIIDLARYDAHIIVFCSEGYASSLAAASLRHLGLSRATDMAGGFRAWKDSGLPVTDGESIAPDYLDAG